MPARHRARRDFLRRHRPIRHAPRHQRVADGGEALVRRQQLRAVRAVVEPHAQPHIRIGKNRVADRHHAERRRAVAECDRVEAAPHRERHARDGLAPGGACAVVAPVGLRAVGIDQREAENPGVPGGSAVEIDPVHNHAALVVDELRHLRARDGEEQGESEDGGETADRRHGGRLWDERAGV